MNYFYLFNKFEQTRGKHYNLHKLPIGLNKLTKIERKLCVVSCDSEHSGAASPDSYSNRNEFNQ